MIAVTPVQVVALVWSVSFALNPDVRATMGKGAGNGNAWI